MNLDQIKQRMEGALDALRREFAGLRTGRASFTHGAFADVVRGKGRFTIIADRKKEPLLHQSLIASYCAMQSVAG